MWCQRKRTKSVQKNRGREENRKHKRIVRNKQKLWLHLLVFSGVSATPTASPAVPPPPSEVLDIHLFSSHVWCAAGQNSATVESFVCEYYKSIFVICWSEMIQQTGESAFCASTSRNWWSVQEVFNTNTNCVINMSNVTSLAAQTKSRVPPTETQTSSAYLPHSFYTGELWEIPQTQKPCEHITKDVKKIKNSEGY